MFGLGLLGLINKTTIDSGVSTGDGTMDFSNADDSALIALLEDI